MYFSSLLLAIPPELILKCGSTLINRKMKYVFLPERAFQEVETWIGPLLGSCRQLGWHACHGLNATFDLRIVALLESRRIVQMNIDYSDHSDHLLAEPLDDSLIQFGVKEFSVPRTSHFCLRQILR